MVLRRKEAFIKHRVPGSKHFKNTVSSDSLTNSGRKGPHVTHEETEAGLLRVTCLISVGTDLNSGPLTARPRAASLQFTV